MGQVSASSSEAQIKLTITSLHGEHDPHAWEQSGKLDPAIWTVSALLLFSGHLSLYKKLGFATVPSLIRGCVEWWCPWSALNGKKKKKRKLVAIETLAKGKKRVHLMPHWIELYKRIGFQPLPYNSFFFNKEFEVEGVNERGSYVFVACLYASLIWPLEEEREQWWLMLQQKSSWLWFFSFELISWSAYICVKRKFETKVWERKGRRTGIYKLVGRRR